jgi:hypothetical protein
MPMRTAPLLKLLPISLLLAGPTTAQGVQNMDISFLLGPVPSSTQTVSGESIKAGAGISFMLTYGYQLHSSRVMDLYLDVPVAWKFNGNATVSSGSVLALSNNRFYCTPGLRLKFNVHERIAPFLVVGLGYGTQQDYVAQVGNDAVAVIADRTGHFVGEGGAGADIRLTKLLSLRGELRMFGTAHHASGIYGVGLAFHF